MLRAIPSHRLEEIDHVDESFDDLWAGLKQRYPLVQARTAAFLRWRFFQNPTGHFRVLKLIRRGGKLEGYAVVSQVRGVALIHDIFAHDDDLGTLLDLLFPSLWLRGCTSVSFCFFGTKRVVDVFCSRGFWARESEHSVFFTRGDSCPTSISGEDEEEWYLTNADADN
jgi:hypothetical protein